MKKQPVEPVPVETLAIAPVTFNAIALREAEAYGLDELSAAQEILIVSDEIAAVYGENLREAKAKLKEIEGQRLAVVTPLNQAHDAVQALFREPKARLGALIEFIEGRLKAWTLAKEKDRLLALAEAAKAATARDGDKLTTALQKSAASQPTKIAGVSIKPKWVARIINPGMITRDYCVPDQKLLDAHAARFRPDEEPEPIPGVKFELDAAMRSTAAKP